MDHHRLVRKTRVDANHFAIRVDDIDAAVTDLQQQVVEVHRVAGLSPEWYSPDASFLSRRQSDIGRRSAGRQGFPGIVRRQPTDLAKPLTSRRLAAYTSGIAPHSTSPPWQVPATTRPTALTSARSRRR